MSAPQEQSHGLYLFGEYLGVKREAGKARANGDGSWPDRYKVGMRVGGDVFDVEYGSVLAAEAALMTANDTMPAKGDTASLTVRARAAKGYVFWMGQEEAGVVGDYE